MASIKNTDIFTKRLIARALAFIIALVLYIIDEAMLMDLINFKFLGIAVYQFVWAFLMLEMFALLIPPLNKYVSTGKCYEHHYLPVENYKTEHLETYTKTNNRRAALTFVLWMIFIASLSSIYYLGYIKQMHIILFVIFLYFLDNVFITVWCPFKAILIKNKCCSTCRIYNWDHAMIFSPLIVIFSFWTYSLLSLAVIIMVYWEYAAHKHPERFSEMSNKKLQCSQCEMKCYRN